MSSFEGVFAHTTNVTLRYTSLCITPRKAPSLLAPWGKVRKGIKLFQPYERVAQKEQRPSAGGVGVSPTT